MIDRRVFIAFIGLLIKSALSAPCSWCDEPTIGTDACVSDGGGWTLVRAIGPSKGSWFRERDQLRGTAEAFDNQNNQYNIGSFESAVAGFNQFLFVTGDCSSWLITSKDAAIGQFYSNSPRQICSSSNSDTPYTARWYHRSGSPEDPWISTVDHGPAIGGGNIVYGENNFGSTHARTVVTPKGGVYVYIRQADLDGTGCSDPQPTPEPTPATTRAPTADCSLLDIDGYLNECSDEFNAVGEVQESIAGYDATLSEVQDSIAGYDATLSGVQESISGYDATLSTVQESIAGYDATLSAVQESVAGYDAALGEVRDQMAEIIERLGNMEDHLSGLSDIAFDADADGDAAYSEPMGEIGYDAVAASEASKDVMLYALVIFNIGTLLGCLSCIYWMRQREAAKQNAFIYEEESK